MWVILCNKLDAVVTTVLTVDGSVESVYFRPPEGLMDEFVLKMDDLKLRVSNVPMCTCKEPDGPDSWCRT